MRLHFIFFFVILSLACSEKPTCSNVNNSIANTNTSATSSNMSVYTYDVVKTYPHDQKAFTQGLVFYNGFFYEGTGGKRSRGDDFYSSLRKVEIETGKVLQKYDVADDVFGEGITILNDKIYQVTWQEQRGFVYDLNDFKKLKEFRYSGEGWGLTNDGTNLIMSDGTHIIRFIDPETFQTVRTIVVNDEKGKPVVELNELEYIKGEIWANIWQEGWIIRIDSASGKLLGRIDLNKLADDEMDKDKSADVLNGIAYDAQNDRIFVTGKKWKQLFEIKVRPKT